MNKKVTNNEDVRPVCKACNGSGMLDEDKSCPACKGSGRPRLAMAQEC